LKWKHFGLQKGDLLISTSASLGRVSVVGAEAVGSVAYTGIIRFRSSSEDLHHEYLRAFLSSKSFVEQAERMATGSVIRHFGPSHLKQMAIALPSIREQVQIARIFDALDGRIRLLFEANSTLEEMGKTLFKSWFIDFDPVHSKQRLRNCDGIDAETAALFPDSFEMSELGEIPRGWKVDKFENWLDHIATGRRPKGGIGNVTCGIPSIGAESILKIGHFDYSKTKYITDDFFSTLKNGVIQSRDVLLYKDGGKPGVFLPRVSMFGDGFPFDTCAINEHVFQLRIKKPFTQNYLYFYVWSDLVMFELKHRGGKAAIPGINQQDVKELKIIVPSPNLLSRFDEIVNPLTTKILNNSKVIQSLHLLRDTLLPRLISGQLRIKDAESLIEEIR